MCGSVRGAFATLRNGDRFKVIVGKTKSTQARHLREDAKGRPRAKPLCAANNGLPVALASSCNWPGPARALASVVVLMALVGRARADLQAEPRRLAANDRRAREAVA